MRIDPATTPRADVYGVLIRTLIPRPIAWVSSVSPDGIRNLAPFSFFTGVTSVPPSVAFCPGRRAETGGTKKDTLCNVEATREFVVNMVSAALGEQMNISATDYAPDVDEFEAAGVTPESSDIVGVPRVAESAVSYECRLLDVFHVGAEGVGGGAIVVGEIVMMHIADSVLRDGKVDARLLDPLARLGGMEYAALGDLITIMRKKPPATG